MALEGTLDVLRLPEVLQMVSMQQKTGILTVQGESDIIAVSFLVGQVVAADALNQTVEDGLGQVLASEGLVRPEDFQRVSAEHATGGERLIDLLVERGLLSRANVLDALRLQTYRLLLQVLRWEHGEFKFYGGDEVAFEDGFRPISIEELLIRSVGDLGEGDPDLDQPRLDAPYQRVPGTTQIKIWGEDGEGPLQDASALWLAPAEQALLQRLDGVRQAGSLGRDVGLSDYQVLYALYRLLQAGLVERVHRPEPLPAAAPTPVAVEPLPVEMPIAEEEDELDASVAEVAARERIMPWVTPIAARALAVGVAFLAVLWAFDQPRRLLMPFPWQATDRAAFAEAQLRTSWGTIRAAATAFYLVEGRFPADLAELSERGLIDASTALDPEGDPLALTTEILGFRLEPVKDGEPVAAQAMTLTATEDLLLDPEVVRPPAGPSEAPLVLLD
jgi:hypothetical protein